MAITPPDVQHAADLACLRFNKEELDAVTERLGAVLAMIDTMQAVDTQGIEPMASPHEATQRLRADTVSESDQRDSLQADAPDVQEGLFVVPQVIE